MIQWLQDIDYSTFSMLHPLGHPYLDDIMYWLSDKYIWIPLYLYITFRLYQAYGSSFYKHLIACILVIIIADQITSSIMKPYFERLRPCRDSQFIDIVISPIHCGGRYGFPSSHAANTFGLATFIIALPEIKIGTFLMIWAVLVSYSRIYLGVHYPGDIIVGAVIGAISALICAKILTGITTHFRAGSTY